MTRLPNVLSFGQKFPTPESLIPGVPMRRLALIIPAVLAPLLFVGSVPLVAQTETVIHAFESNNKYDGANPLGGTVADGSGALYGFTISGGKYNYGTVYKLAPPAQSGGDWKQNILYSFTGPDGQFPVGIPLLGKNLTIYGTTLFTTEGYGAVFQLSPPTAPGGAWTASVLHGFTGGVDGGEPSTGVVIDSLGRLYGTTQFGGTAKVGLIFRLTPPAKPGGTWTERVLYNFQGGSDGGAPSRLIFDSSGALYGTTNAGGDLTCGLGYGCGTVFKLSPPENANGAWTKSILYSFTGNLDGLGPSSGLIFDSSGALYGVTAAGGGSSCVRGDGCGTVFKLTPPTDGNNWTDEILYAFQGGEDGIAPEAALLFNSAGALYGTTAYGGGTFKNCSSINGGCGIAFKLTPPNGAGSWVETILHAFTGVNDGEYPQAPLTWVGTDLYGTTYEGIGTCIDGAGCGTVFQIAQ